MNSDNNSNNNNINTHTTTITASGTAPTISAPLSGGHSHNGTELYSWEPIGISGSLFIHMCSSYMDKYGNM